MALKLLQGDGFRLGLKVDERHIFRLCALGLRISADRVNVSCLWDTLFPTDLKPKPLNP